MSAATSQPIVGHSKSAAPFGAVALIAGVLTFGAIGIALGQGAKATPAAGAVPADVQAALIAQRLGEKASLFPDGDTRLLVNQAELADRALAAAPDARILVLQAEQAERFGGASTSAGASDPRLIQHMGELRDRIAGPVVYGTIVTSDGRIFGRPRAIPVKPNVIVLPNGRIIPLYPSTNLGPKTSAQKGLVPASQYSGKVMDPTGASAADAGFNEWAVREAARYGTVSSYPGKVQDDVIVTVNRWTVLATNPYSQGLLSRTVSLRTDAARSAHAMGGKRITNR